MSTSPVSIRLLVCRTEDEFAVCVDYVVRTFARFCGWSVEYCVPEELAFRLAGASRRPAVLLYAAAQDIEGLVAKAAGTYEFLVAVERGPFFGRQFLTTRDLPVRASVLRECLEEVGFGKHLGPAGHKALRLDFDLLAAAFWFLTRYEEYVASVPADVHGRFLCAHSAAPPDLYDLPLVNRLFEWLQKVYADALRLTPLAVVRLRGRPTVALTHDVDRLSKYRGRGGAQRALAELTRPQTSIRQAGHAALVVAGMRRDPYDSFDDLFAVKDRTGAPSTWFFMAGGTSRHDADYALTDPSIAQLMARVRSATDEIALHPSYDSFRDGPMIARQAEALRAVAGKPVRGVRQHYLRFKTPDTWHAQLCANARYDSTMAFADRAGFRCGWSGCFHPFDVEKRTELSLIEIPTIVMDMSLSVYERLPAEKAVERLAALLEASTTRGGCFVLLWHNTLRDEAVHPGYWGTLEYFLSAAAGSVHFTTLNGLCRDFETTVAE
ncbi:MAG: polysaccharide deacetylase family protein [Candidatus Sumerlaeaceae bacterium]|nr:polysaccharide deacetylase family protein [Candidatus Sumerlaeaceae bacterium]